MKKFFDNARKPKGFLGKVVVRMMNIGHKKCAEWGFSNIPTKNYETILDIGCGGGANVKRFIKKYPEAHVYAVDYSNISVKETTKLNSKSIKNGKLKVLQANISKLPFDDNQFDLVSAFETIYFWPNLLENFKEVYRTIKPKGIFIIVNGVNQLDEYSRKWVENIEEMKIYNREELEYFFKNVGFKNITTFIDKKWIFISGEK